jgi:hypothetical protein
MGQCIANSPVVLLARVVDADGVAVSSTNVSSLQVKVFDRGTGTQIGTAATPAVDEVVFDTLMTDARWSADDVGYNFACPIAGQYFPSGDTTYRVEVKVTPTGQDAFYLLWDLDCTEIFSQ